MAHGVHSGIMSLTVSALLSLLPFTISDMDFATAPCIIEALNQRLMHGVFGCRPLEKR
ncbi:hypothetical protein ACLK14_09360 [Escherichia coli]